MLKLGCRYRILDGIKSFSHRAGVIFNRDPLEESLKELGVMQALHLAHTPDGDELMVGISTSLMGRWISFLVSPDEKNLELIN